jgi:hypothetical protein
MGIDPVDFVIPGCINQDREDVSPDEGPDFDSSRSYTV